MLRTRALTEAAIELKQLRFFVRIVELGSLSRAAGALHIAQSALSQHVATLEEELQAQLLLRTARGVQPTEAGRILYRHAQALLQQANDARTAVQSASDAPAGNVAFGLPLSLVAPFGLEFFIAMRRQHPAIRLQLQEELSGTILEWVKNGRLAMGIAFDDGDLEGLRTVPFLEERLFLVAAARSSWAKRKVVTLRELVDHELVLPTLGQGVRARVDKALGENRMGRAHVSAEIDSLTLLKQAAAQGIAPTILGWMSVEAEVARGELVAVEIVRPSITRVAHVCTPVSTSPTRAVECVQQVLLEVVREATQRPDRRGLRMLYDKPV